MSASPASGSSSTWEHASETEARIAYVQLARPRGERWLDACYALTPRVERVSADRALLDLGRCSSAEALVAIRRLLSCLHAHKSHAVAGIGPSMTLAQLAVFCAPPSQSLTLISTAEASVFLRHTPVRALAALHANDSITPEIIERLQRYGLRTLGHLAHIKEPSLRRQFGKAGAFLLAAAAGRDERPMQTTARPARHHFRLRFSTGASIERALAILPRFARRTLSHLHGRQRTGHSLRLRVRWASGSLSSARVNLRQPISRADTLTQDLRRLLDAQFPSSRGAMIEEMRLTIGDFTLAVPDQMTLWRTHAQRRLVVEMMADTLTRRHGRPLLHTPYITTPAAIFAEDRYQFDALSVSGAGRLERSEGSDAYACSEMGGGRAGNTSWQQAPQRLHWW